MTTVVWKGGMAFDGQVSTGQTVPMDAAADHGGQNAGARPMELLLAALGGCTGMDVVSILGKKRQLPESFRMEIEGDRREEFPKVFTAVRITFILKGKDLTEEAVKRAVALSQEKYCSVAATLKGAGAVTYSYRIER